MNAVQRFIRSRVLLLTASILIFAMCLSVLVQTQSQAALNRTVDQNSRGLYDILVQARAGSDGTLMQPGGTDPSKWPAAQSVLSDTPKKYRLTASATSSDGSSQHTLFKSTAEGTLGKGKLVEQQVEGGNSIQI